MNSFTLTAVGHLARNPELIARGSMAYTRFCLVGTDYAGKDEEGAAREVVTSLWFVAFGALGEAVARHSRKGDQLVVEARVRANNWTDKQGEKQYDHAFVVQGFRFGAPGRMKREERDARREDGHGLHRCEDRPNGRDRSANGVSPGSGPRNGVASHTGAAAWLEHGDGAMSGAVGGTNRPAGVRSAISVRVPARGNDGSGAKGSADADGAPDGDKASDAGESANTHGSIDADEPGATGDSGGADESGGTGESAVADKPGDTGQSAVAEETDATVGLTGTDETEAASESAGANETDVVSESAAAPDTSGASEYTGSDESGTGQESAGTHEASGTATRNRTDKPADSYGAKSSAKGAPARVAHPRAATSRTREKSGGGRAGRRASTSAA